MSHLVHLFFLAMGLCLWVTAEENHGLSTNSGSRRPAPPPLKEQPPLPESKGRVAGTATRHSGDLMPRTDDKPRVRRVEPLKRIRLFVFEGELAQKKDPDGFAIPQEIDTLGKRPVATTMTGEDGSFSLDLPPGTYTVVAEIDGKLQHADGAFPRYPRKTWTTVKVRKGRVLRQDFIDDKTTH